MALSSMQSQKVFVRCDSANFNHLYYAVLSVFINLRSAECVFILWTSCLFTSKRIKLNISFCFTTVTKGQIGHIVCCTSKKHGQIGYLPAYDTKIRHLRSFL